MKTITVTLASLMIGVASIGQIDGTGDLTTLPKGSGDSTKTWTKGGTFNLNATQVSLSNWAGGGQNSVSLQGILGLYANYSKGKNAWDNSLDLAYGIIRQGSADALWLKNDDRIELNSKYGRKISDHWYFGGLLNFRTQFVYGYANTLDQVNNQYLSNIMAPSFTTVAVGFDYKPNTKFSAFISPAALKLTTVLDDSLSNAGAFGVEEGNEIRTEFGGYVKASFVEPKVFGNENLGFKTALTLFSNYQDNPQNIDITWDASLTAKVAKYFTVSLSTNLVYDHDIDILRVDENGLPVMIGGNQKSGPITQFKQVLALGFAYKF